MFDISFLVTKKIMKEKSYLLTIKDLCIFLKIGKNTAYDLVHSGEIKSFRVRNQIRIPETYVLKYIQKQQHKGKFCECRHCLDETGGDHHDR